MCTRPERPTMASRPRIQSRRHDAPSDAPRHRVEVVEYTPLSAEQERELARRLARAIVAGRVPSPGRVERPPHHRDLAEWDMTGGEELLR